MNMDVRVKMCKLLCQSRKITNICIVFEIYKRLNIITYYSLGFNKKPKQSQRIDLAEGLRCVFKKEKYAELTAIKFRALIFHK